MIHRSFLRLSFLLLISAGSFTALSAQAPAGYTLLYQDKFDGNHVNEKDWVFRVDRRQLGTWVNGLDRAENVSVHDGALHIALRKEKIDGRDEYTGGGLISRHQFGYGYYECLSRPFMSGKGTHTSFWQMGGVIPNNNIFEIDSYEIDSGDFMGTNNLYMHLKPPDGKEVAWPLRSSEPWAFRPDGWYLDAFEYTPDGIIYYDNGKVSAHAEYRDLTAAQTVWLTALNGIRGLDESKQPGEAVFKYFRYYAKDYPGINILPNGDFEYNQQAGPAISPVAWQPGGTPESSYVATGDAPHGRYLLRQGSDAHSYTASVTQSLEYILNGGYQLSAMVRSSGGQSLTQIRVSGFGGKDLVMPIAATKEWKQVTIPRIPVTSQSVTISIESAGSAGQWLEADNVQLMKPPLSGQQPRDPEPFSFRRDPIWKAAQRWPLKFEGDDSFIMLDRNVGEGEAVSITFRIAPRQLEDTVPIERAPRSGSAGWSVLLTRTGDVVFRIGSQQQHEDLVAQSACAPGRETRVTATFENGTASLFIDGQVAARKSQMSVTTNGNTAIGKVGYSGDEYAAVGDITLKSAGEKAAGHAAHFAGSISDLRIYNRALRAEETAAR